MSVVTGVALLALALLLLADAVLRGRWDVAVLSLPALGVMALAALEILLRPGLRVSPRGVTVTNPFRTVELPWSQVADVSTRFQVVVETHSGERIRCWGAPTASRVGPRLDRSRGRAGGGVAGWAPASTANRVIAAHWAQYSGAKESPGGAGITRRWHWVTLGVTSALVALAVAAQLVRG